MTREQAEHLAASGVARWDGSTLVMIRLGPPLMHRGRPVVLDSPSHPCRFSWPGWARSSAGDWARVGEDFGASAE
jgi:hypothetical protein